jgi:DNA adenine methylase
MKIASPLRYPGGKAAISDILRQIRKLNRLGGLSIAEPFAGGAGASLTMLYLEETQKIYINDADPAIHSFWWCIVKRPDPFIRMIDETCLTLNEWYRQRDIYRNSGRLSKLKRGYSAFYLNRCNRSGIIVNGGPIGGIEQKGKWKIDARFNKKALRQRCERIVEYRERIQVSCQDGIKFIKNLEDKPIFFFVDPPYYHKGNTLYLNALDKNYHMSLSVQLKSMSDKPWVLTYDDCPEIRQMYQGWATIRPFSLRYVASKKRSGKEILIVPNWMNLPETQDSALVGW